MKATLTINKLYSCLNTSPFLIAQEGSLQHRYLTLPWSSWTYYWTAGHLPICPPLPRCGHLRHFILEERTCRELVPANRLQCARRGASLWGGFSLRGACLLRVHANCKSWQMGDGYKPLKTFSLTPLITIIYFRNQHVTWSLWIHRLISAAPAHEFHWCF